MVQVSREQQALQPLPRKGADSLVDRLKAGHMLSDDELRELHALKEAEAIAGRLQAGHMISGDDLALLQRAAAADKVHAGPPSQGVALSHKRSRETFSELQARPPNRPSHRQALAELQQSALLLMSGGLDIGDMRLSDVIERRTAKPFAIEVLCSCSQECLLLNSILGFTIEALARLSVR